MKKSNEKKKLTQKRKTDNKQINELTIKWKCNVRFTLLKKRLEI